MLLLTEEDRKIISKMIGEVSKESLQKNWESFMKYTPIPSGSPQEEMAAQFLKEKLKEYDLEPEILRYEAYLSEPKWAKLEVLEPQEVEVQCTPYRQVGTTGPEGIEGEVIYISPEDIGIAECRGKIVLAEQSVPDDWMGLRNGKLLKLERMGVKGLIVIEQDSFMPTVCHQRADFSVSGNPTSDNVHLIQRIPAIVHVSNKDGQYLKKLVRQGGMRVRITSIVETGWKTLPLLVAEIKGTKDPDKFLLLSGHMDTPPFSPGVVDNASGVVAILELARILSKYRDKLGRSIRIAFWTGHEIGRYAGSTWYNDVFWHDLRYNCICVFNIDSPGAEGATQRGVSGVSELWEAAADGLKAVTGFEVKPRLGMGSLGSRSGDRSFWGTGLPHTGAGSTRPQETRDPFVNASGGGWWWHTPYATMDRGDVDVLATDVKVQLNYIFRVTNSTVLPLNWVPFAEAVLRTLEDFQEKAEKVKAYFNLYPVVERAKEFRALAEKLEETGRSAVDKGASEEALEALNRGLIWVGRHMHPVAHSDAGITEQMSMETFGATPFPRIYEILKLADMTLPQSPEFKFLVTKLVRQRNLVEDAFYQTNEFIKETIAKVEKSLL
ncbi:MAG: M28 family peptidase [Candidatus Bathyarchaeia archaeon]